MPLPQRNPLGNSADQLATLASRYQRRHDAPPGAMNAPHEGDPRAREARHWRESELGRGSLHLLRFAMTGLYPVAEAQAGRPRCEPRALAFSGHQRAAPFHP